MQPSIVTREYFNSVNRMMDDLRVHQSTNVNFTSNAKLMLRFARRIRQLPTNLVDESVVEFADDAIEMLVESATELRYTSEKNKTERAGVRTRRARAGTDDFGIISMGSRATRSRYGRFGRFSSGSGGTGKYERNEVSQKNAEGVWRVINQKLAEFEKASLALQSDLENKYDMDF